MEKIVLVLTTVPDSFDAWALARTLVNDDHAACVSVLAPQMSTYRWEGTIETAHERQLLIKTTESRTPALEAAIKAAHPYEVPEFLIVPVMGGADAYLAWVRGA
jgi:periplasmic divalent cation tolerance protein